MELKSYFVDTETVGLHGVPVLLQYSIDKGPIKLVHVWHKSAGKLMSLIEDICDNRVIAHNLRFDWFHISKLYNMLRQIEDKTKCLSDFETQYWGNLEWHSQFGPCLKPRAAVDTLLLAAKSENQSFLMDSKAVYVRRVPLGISDAVCEELNARTNLPWILFAGKKKDPDERWVVADNTDQQTGEVDPLFKDVKITFAPSKGLKQLHAYLFDSEATNFDEIMCDYFVTEEGYAPFATLLSSETRNWKYNEGVTWPAVVRDHTHHWMTSKNAQKYAEDDITKLIDLYEFFGSPEDDRDAILACQVASVRLRGFACDMDAVRKQHSVSTQVVTTAAINVDSPKQVLGYVSEALDEMEQLFLINGCDQKVIDSIKQEFTLDEREDCYCDNGRVQEDETGTTDVCRRCDGAGAVGPTGPCEVCDGSGDGEELDQKGEPKKCESCDGSGFNEFRKMPVVRRVEHVEHIRRHKKRIQLFDKLLLAKRAYPDFNVIGTKSGRMSGASGLNWHGIDHSEVVRSIFTLADPGLVLSAGDYSSQELAIAATTMNDVGLMRDMESGKSLHGLFGAEAYETTYEDIVSNKDDGRYGKAKGGVYAILYGGTFQTVAKNMDVTEGVAEAAYNRLCARYPQMANTRQAVSDRFSSMKQNPDGKIDYFDPPEKFIESIFGYRRYFETEYEVQKMIIDLIKNMPTHIKEAGAIYKHKHPMCQPTYMKVERKEGKLQTLASALCSALYGAGFSIQNKIIRASNNHVIQSTGRELTVGMQAHVWEMQPCGVHEFVLTLMSIHDELAVVSKEDMLDKIRDTVTEKVEEQCEFVPLTSIDWFTHNKSWAEKGSGENKTVIGWSPKELV